MYTNTLQNIIDILNGKDFAYIHTSVQNGNVYTFSKFDTLEALKEKYADKMDIICLCLWADDDNVVYISM